jgi:pantoate--beta-alanine ligase
MRDVIHRNAPDGEIDYLQAVSWSDLQPVHRVEQRTLLALAVYFGNVRLIDNLLLEPDHS